MVQYGMGFGAAKRQESSAWGLVRQSDRKVQPGVWCGKATGKFSLGFGAAKRQESSAKVRVNLAEIRKFTVAIQVSLWCCFIACCAGVIVC